MLRFLRNQSDLPWLCVGDFNEILHEDEQMGGNDREEWCMEGFREAVEYCGFPDLGFKGLLYTWDNRREGSRNIKVRLDRRLADNAWLDRFGESSATHIQTTESDHCAVHVHIVRTGIYRGGGRDKPFRYENMWQRHHLYNDTVAEAWSGGCTSLGDVNASLGQLQSTLIRWDRDEFGSVKGELRQLRKRLEFVRGRTIRKGPSPEERRIMARLSELLAWEEAMEKQRSRVQWLHEGDRNTGFFQAKAKQRARTNKITVLRRSDGSLYEAQEELEALAAAFYQNLFMAQEDTSPDLVTQHVPRKVTEGMNDVLTDEYSYEDVRKVVFMMHLSKSPGPDGFTAGFYQRHWELIGHDISTAVLAFLNGGEISAVVNSTILVLIPKVRNPQELTQFRPISLCNVLYKICSKVIANRLRTVLDEIISEEQSAFVPGRLVTDNVLVAYECIHYLSRKKGKTGACAVKLGMAKAYDRVEWAYLQAVLLKLGFHDSSVQLIMQCVETVSFRVRVNGKLSEPFVPSRGIQQGDPLSPYLFLLCAEGFSSMLKNVGPRYLSRGVRVGVHSPWVSHLLFADDCLLFTQASERGSQRRVDILNQYQRGSGQLVNIEKSAIFFNNNCEDTDKEVVKQTTGIHKEALCEKYLGLPTAVGRSTKDVFEAIPTKIRGLMNGWGEKQLSCAARETLIKSVAQAIPTYSMSCFILAPSTCQKITSATSNYWWNSGVDRRGMHWRNWPDMCLPKSQGGLGFRDIKQFNMAMLGKQGWRLMVSPESLCARVLKGKYYHNCDFMSATKKKNASHAWRAILADRKVLQMGCIRRIGDGSATNIWRDQWLPGCVGLKPLCRKDGAMAEQVSELISTDGLSWDNAALDQNLIPLDAAVARRIPLGHSTTDEWAWSGVRHGLYTIKSGYRMLAAAEAQQRDFIQRKASHSSNADDLRWKKL